MSKNIDKHWGFKALVSEFIRNNPKVLDLDSCDEEFIFDIAYSKDNLFVTSLSEEYFESKKDYYSLYKIPFSKNTLSYEDESFNLIISKNGNYQIDEVKRLLKKGGHFITEQTGSSDVSYKKDVYDFNLENESAKYRSSGFKLVKSDQIYFTDGFELKHKFYMVLKSI